MKVLTPKNVKITLLVVLRTKLFVLIIKLLSELLFIDVEIQLMNSILKEYKSCRKIMNKYFNKNLIMSEEEEHLFNKVTVVEFVKNLLIMM